MTLDRDLTAGHEPQINQEIHMAFSWGTSTLNLLPDSGLLDLESRSDKKQTILCRTVLGSGDHTYVIVLIVDIYRLLLYG